MPHSMKMMRVVWLLLFSLGRCVRRLTAANGGNRRTENKSSVGFSGAAHSNPDEGGGVDGNHSIPIMIMALGRSGSTLIGDLFKNDEDMFYMYEPCRSRANGVLDKYNEFHQGECLAYLHRIFRCDFTVKDADKLLSDKQAVQHSSPIFLEMRAAIDDGKKVGGGANADALDHAHHVLLDTCKNSRAVVVKTIRVYDGIDESTSSLVSGVNVLHLVRDPRAVVRSELLHFGVGHFSDDIPNYRELQSIGDQRKKLTEERRAIGGILCGHYRMQLDSRPHLDGKYLRVRYEDFSLLPQVATQLIFSHFGLGDVPSSLAAWIEENTTIEDCEDAAGQGIRRGLRQNQKRQLAPVGWNRVNLLAVHDEAGGGKELNERTEVAEVAVAPAVAPAAASSAFATKAFPQPPRKMLRSREQSSVSLAAAEVGLSSPPARRAKPSDPSIAPGGGVGPSHGPPTPRLSKIGTTTPGLTGGADLVQAIVSDGEILITKGQRALGENRCSNELEAEEHPYDTKRDSRSMAYLWREEIPPEDSLAVWEACGDSRVMFDLKYSP